MRGDQGTRPFSNRQWTESWLKDIAHDFTLGWIGVDSSITLVMTHAFGRVPLPPEVAGILTATHLLRNAFSEDRQGIQQLATAWFTDQSPAITDPTRWHLRLRRPHPRDTFAGSDRPRRRGPPTSRLS